MTVRGDRQNVQVIDTLFGSADLRALQGDVYFIETKDMKRDLRMEYRAAQGDFCLTQRGSTTVTEDPVWSGNAGAAWTNCDIRVAPWWQARTIAHYDNNKDGFIEKTEFSEQLGALPKCCGGACPYRSFCAKYEFLLFPTTTSENATSNSFSGRSSILTDSVFLSRLVALEDYTLVPLCMRIITAKNDVSPSGNTIYARLISNRGGIHVHRELDGTYEATDATTTASGTKFVERNGTDILVDPQGYSYYFPADRVPGLKMSSPDADDILGEVRDVYGPRDATEDVFVTIDVHSTPGVRASRWVYTTRPIFLYLQPALIEFLSAGLLNPTLKHYVITMRNDTCAYPLVKPVLNPSADQQAFTPQLPEDHSAVASALMTSLVPRFQLQMRGLLVQVGDQHRPRPETVDLMLWTQNTAGALLATPLQTGNDENTEAAVWLSLLMALLLAFMATGLIVMYLRAMLKANYETAVIRRKLLAVKAEALAKKENEAVEAQLAGTATAEQSNPVLAVDDSDPKGQAARETAPASADKQADGTQAPASNEQKVAPDSKVSPRGAVVPLVEAPEGSPVSQKAPLAPPSSGRSQGTNASQEAADAADVAAAVEANDQGELDASAEKPNFNPFETPMEIVDLLFLVPIKRYLLNSVSKFVNERCVVHVAPLADDDEEEAAAAAQKEKEHSTGKVAPGAGTEDALVATSMDQSEGVAKGARMGGIHVKDMNGNWVQAGLLPAVLKAEFMERYSQYCYLNNLAEQSNFDLIRQRLIEDFNLRVRSVPEETLRGITWKDGTAPTTDSFTVRTDVMTRLAGMLGTKAANARENVQSRASSVVSDEENSVQQVESGLQNVAAAFGKPGTASAAMAGGDAAASRPATAPGAGPTVVVADPTDEEPEREWDDDDAFLLDSFLKKYCDITRKYTDDALYFANTSIVREGDDGTRFRENVDGFYPAFANYCEKVHKMEPATESETIALLRELHGVQHERKRVTRVLGLTFIDFSAADTDERHQARLTASWYAMEALTVFVHMAFLLLPPLLVMLYAMGMQYTHGLTMAGLGDDPLSPYDFNQFPPNLEGKSLVFVVELLMYFVAVYSGLAIIRLIFRYLSLPAGLLRKFIRRSFAWVLVAVTFAFLTWAGLVFTWFILAAALDPVRFLPYAGGIVASVAVLAVTWSKLKAAAGILRKRMLVSFKNHMNKAVMAAKKAMEQVEKFERQKEVGMIRKKNKTGAAAASKGASDAKEGKGGSQEYSIEDVFSLINADGDAVISADEFDDLFDKLQLNVSKQKRSQMFAYCDRDGSGFVDAAEFTDAWAYLEEQIINETLDDLGVSNTAIIAAVIYLAVCLAVLLSFLFLAIAAWENSSGFEAVIQTLLVSGSAGLTSFARSQSKGESADENELQAIIDGVVESDEQKPV